MKDKIVYVAGGRVGYGKRNLSEEQLHEFEREYIEDCKRKCKLIEGAFKPPVMECMLERFISPLNYWIDNKLFCEQTNETKQLQETEG